MNDDVGGLDRSVPGWLLRVAILAAGGLLVVSLAAGRLQGPFDAVPAFVLLLLAAAAPGGPVPGLFLVAVAATQLVADPGAPAEVSLLWRLPIAAALLHAVHTLCALAAGIPARSRLEVAVLRRPALRWLAAQAFSLPVAIGVGWLLVARATSSRAPLLTDWAVLPAGIAAAVVVLIPVALLRRRR